MRNRLRQQLKQNLNSSVTVSITVFPFRTSMLPPRQSPPRTHLCFFPSLPSSKLPAFQYLIINSNVGDWLHSYCWNRHVLRTSPTHTLLAGPLILVRMAGLWTIGRQTGETGICIDKVRCDYTQCDSYIHLEATTGRQRFCNFTIPT